MLPSREPNLRQENYNIDRGPGMMSTIEKNEGVVKYTLEPGVRVIVIQDGNIVENEKLGAYEECTFITQDNKLLDMKRTTRKRYRVAK
jgi:hypothetical protein